MKEWMDEGMDEGMDGWMDKGMDEGDLIWCLFSEYNHRNKLLYMVREIVTAM